MEVGAATAATPLLYKPFPNPAAAETTVPFRLPGEMTVEILLYDIHGSLVRAVLCGQTRTEGYHTIPLDVTALNSGVYLLRLTASGVTRTERMVVRK